MIYVATFILGAAVASLAWAYWRPAAVRVDEMVFGRVTRESVRKDDSSNVR